MNKHIVLCDDFTGAMDAGVQLLSRNTNVKVLSDFSMISSYCEDGIIMINTQSRNISMNDSKEKILECIKAANENNYNIIYKKVDSTLRGNLGSELEAIIESDITDIIVFAPALPYNKRKTIDGMHYIDGKPLIKSDIAKDPFSSINSSNIKDIINKQTKLKTVNLYLTDIREGIENIKKTIFEAYESNCKIIIADSQTEIDLMMLAVAVFSINNSKKIKLLPSGSAGLMYHISNELFKGNIINNTIHFTSNKPVLVLSGSPALVTKKQIAFAQEKGLTLFKLEDIYDKSDKQDIDISIADVIVNVIYKLKRGEHVIIDGAASSKESISNKYRNKPEQLAKKSQIIQKILSKIAREVLSAIKLSGLIIVGGDTSLSIMNEMRIEGLKIIDEPEPYVICGEVYSGKYKNLKIITKAGGFGKDNTIISTIKWLTGEKSETKKA